MEADHVHCMSCINQRCTTKPQAGISCDVAACSLVCGAVFHTCKAPEHRLLCPLEKVPCLNTGFGCPASVVRGRMSSHLEACPAGVVCCTMEWNRWPVSCLDYTSYESLSRGVEDAQQLDMALALQDQRTLLESLKVVAMAPTAIAVAAPDDDDDDAMDSAPAPAPLVRPQLSPPSPRQQSPRQPSPLSLAKEKIANGINGLTEEHYSQLYEATVETARSLAAALDVFSGRGSSPDSESRVKLREQCNGLGAPADLPAEADLMELDEHDAHSKGSGETGCRMSATASGPPSEPLGGAVEAPCPDEGQLCDTVTQGSSVFQAMIMPPLPVTQSNAQRACHVVLEDRGLVLLEERGVERRFPHHLLLRGTGHFLLPNGQRGPLPGRSPGWRRPRMEDKAVDTSDLEQQKEEEETVGLSEVDPITAALLFCLEESRECRRISDTVFVDGYRVDFGTQTFTFPAAILVTSTRVGDMASASACDHAAPQLSSPSPLRLGLVLQALEVPRLQHTFPFVCGQLFRRDQFAGHFANVHGDIHAGLNGWMEQRCPLAYYGCTFSQRRFYPSTRGARVVHDRHLRAFGVQPCPGPAEPQDHTRPDCFSALPVEILWHVADFLDSFSLCQLSVVSRPMRELCASLLQARGIVELQWERRQCPSGFGTVSWHVKNKVWKFSTSFSPVSSWRFTDLPSMSDHLRKCRFNTVDLKTEPIPLPAMCTARDGHSLRRVLRHVNT